MSVLNTAVTKIDPRAIIDPSAKIGADVTIGPWTQIGADVEIGDGCRIGPHVVINGPCRIGKLNQIFQFASLGEGPQYHGYNGEPTELIVGDHNIIREFVSMNRATTLHSGKTIVGSHNYFMNYTHVAHDCVVGNHVTFANNAQIAGHVVIDDYVTLGAYTGIHQFVHIGQYAFLGRATKIVQDILPYMMVYGNPGAPVGLNKVGLQRQGFSAESLKILRRAHKIIYRQGLQLKEAVAELQTLVSECPEVQALLNAIARAERGIAR